MLPIYELSAMARADKINFGGERQRKSREFLNIQLVDGK